MTKHFSGMAGPRAELHQTGGEGNQTITSGHVCFRISKSCSISPQRSPTDGLLPKGVKMCGFQP